MGIRAITDQELIAAVHHIKDPGTRYVVTYESGYIIGITVPHGEGRQRWEWAREWASPPWDDAAINQHLLLSIAGSLAAIADHLDYMNNGV